MTSSVAAKCVSHSGTVNQYFDEYRFSIGTNTSPITRPLPLYGDRNNEKCEQYWITPIQMIKLSCEVQR